MIAKRGLWNAERAGAAFYHRVFERLMRLASRLTNPDGFRDSRVGPRIKSFARARSWDERTAPRVSGRSKLGITVFNNGNTNAVPALA